MAISDRKQNVDFAPFHLVLEASHNQLLFSRFERDSPFTGWEWLGNPSEELKEKIEHWLKCYLSKKPIALNFSVNLEIATPFFKHVYSKLMDVPFGTHLSYEELAIGTGRPRAARAIGQACGRNPYMLFVPCHRVLAKGKIGGFGCGLEVKNALLKFEGIEIKKT